MGHVGLSEEFGTSVSPKEILLAEEEPSMFRYFASENEMSSKYSVKNRYLPGLFTILTDANCAEISISSCTTAYDITTDQTISINCVKLGTFHYFKIILLYNTFSRLIFVISVIV